MSSPGLTGPHCVTLDASFVIGLCAKEPGKYPKAQTFLRQRVAAGCTLHAPHLLVMEAAYVLCGKLQAGTLTTAEHLAASRSSELSTFDVGQQSQAAAVAPSVVVTLLTP